jgi:hypothetical protein
MIELARHLVRHAGEMSEEQLRDSQLRVEWLAEEIWRAAVHGPLEGSRGPEDR